MVSFCTEDIVLKYIHFSVHQIKAEQIMVVNVKYITQQTTYRQLRDLLASAANLRSFPVVTDNGNNVKFLIAKVTTRACGRVQLSRSVLKNLLCVQPVFKVPSIK